jgi:hypothetical protein
MRYVTFASRTLVGSGVAALVIAGLALVAEPVAAQRGAAPPPAAQPAGPMPRVSVGGIRVVGPGVGANATELRPFNESAGTTIVLLVTAPDGTGIVELDDDTSTIRSVVDDKGKTLLEEGRLGPFPKVSDDGSAGLIELEVRARPSPGATSITAQGTLTVTTANGSKPTRVPGVRLEVARTFKLGTTTITVKEIEADGEATNVTLGLPRQAMSAIRSVHFLTAAGAAIESRRTGSGYMNDDGEFSFNVKTKDKVVALEFDLWQNLKSVKVPFSIKVGLGL